MTPDHSTNHSVSFRSSMSSACHCVAFMLWMRKAQFGPRGHNPMFGIAQDQDLLRLDLARRGRGNQLSPQPRDAYGFGIRSVALIIALPLSDVDQHERVQQRRPDAVGPEPQVVVDAAAPQRRPPAGRR